MAQKPKLNASERTIVAGVLRRLAERDRQPRPLAAAEMSAARAAAAAVGAPWGWEALRDVDPVEAERAIDELETSRCLTATRTRKAREAMGPKRKAREEDNRKFARQVREMRREGKPDVVIAGLLGISRGRLVRLAGRRRK